MDEGYAQRARSPPAFPEAPEATEGAASSSVILCSAGLNLGCLVRKYAVVQPMMPPPVKCQRCVARHLLDTDSPTMTMLRLPSAMFLNRDWRG